MTFIAYNPENIIISIVVAKSKELALAFWQGYIGTPHTIKCVETDFEPLEDHPTGVFPILKTSYRKGNYFTAEPIKVIR